jgi:hypothetical protein
LQPSEKGAKNVKWYERTPVRKGDLVRMTVLGVSGLYRVRRDASDAMNLRLCDLVLEEGQGDGRDRT